MDLEPVWRRIDRIAGSGRERRVVDLPDDVRVRRAFRTTSALLVLASLLSVTAVLIAGLLAEEREPVSPAVWLRCTAVMGISFTLFYFAARARCGHAWAYRRLQLFSRVFPVIALVLATIPGLYPGWVVAEQLVFAALLIGVSRSMRVPPLRRAFTRPIVS